MWNVVSRAAISVSAALEELWFRGDLLGIFFLSVLFFFFELCFLLMLSLVFGSVAVRYGELWKIDGFQETSSPYVGVAVLCADDV